MPNPIGPLLPADEQFTHQIVDTFATVGSTDLSWTEKVCAMAAARDGSLQLGFGLGKYTNRDVMDCYAGVSRGVEQLTVRASRRLTPEPELTVVGPIHYEVHDALRTVRFALDANECQPIAFDWTFEAVVPPHVEDRTHMRDGYRVSAELVRYHQTGVGVPSTDLARSSTSSVSHPTCRTTPRTGGCAATGSRAHSPTGPPGRSRSRRSPTPASTSGPVSTSGSTVTTTANGAATCTSTVNASPTARPRRTRAASTRSATPSSAWWIRWAEARVGATASRSSPVTIPTSGCRATRPSCEHRTAPGDRGAGGQLGRSGDRGSCSAGAQPTGGASGSSGIDGYRRGWSDLANPWPNAGRALARHTRSRRWWMPASVSCTMRSSSVPFAIGLSTVAAVIASSSASEMPDAV
jgi:hypothetical protein